MKLSDAMRGAADRAPVDGITLSAADASRRVSRQRAVRTGSNGLVAVGAVAILGVGLFTPAFAGAADEAMEASAENARGEAATGDGESMLDAPADASSEAGGDAAGSMLAEQWLCGSTFSADDPAWSYGDASGVAFEADDPEPVENGYEVRRLLTVSRPVDFLAAEDYLIVWDGIVVGRYVSPSPVVYGPADEPSLPDGAVYERLDPATDFSSLESWLRVDAVNCWDGAPLPAADYELHLAQTLAYPAPGGDDGPTIAPSPDDRASDVPGEDDAVAEDGGVDGDGVDGDAQAVEPLPSGDPGMPELFRVAADPVTLTIDGERIDDPFGAYLGTEEPAPLPSPSTVPSLPAQPTDPSPSAEPTLPKPTLPLGSDVLTPDAARTLFQESATDSAWDMAAGTHRWLMNGGSSDPYLSYGCSWGGEEGTKFPAPSSTMDLLELDVDAPSSMAVSYGFVVDGNPKISSTLTNVSEFAVVSLWGGPQPQLYLARDGKVVAEGYPTSISGNRGFDIQMEERGIAIDGAAMTIAPVDAAEALAPGDSMSGDYLWRDVTRCDGAQGGVEPGTYTLLATTGLSVAGGVVTYEGDALGGGALDTPSAPPLIPEERGLDSKAGTLDGSAAPSPAPSFEGDVAIGVAPQEDWLDLQLWTSLGSLTVR